jgi:hypothetical protein
VKKRWAERSAAQDRKAPKRAITAKKTKKTKKTKKRVLSAEARKKMSDAAKKRWAHKRKAA